MTIIARRKGENGNGVRVAVMRYLQHVTLVGLVIGVVFQAGMSYRAIAANEKAIVTLTAAQKELAEKYAEAAAVQAATAATLEGMKENLDLIRQYVVPPPGNRTQ
tara:strand:+ start:1126 stop:1440 length:315 start_codon:yes stop_codon:yes gene_type:complete